MMGKKLNIFFYKDGEYTRAYSSVAPTVFENGIDTFTQSDVEVGGIYYDQFLLHLKRRFED